MTFVEIEWRLARAPDSWKGLGSVERVQVDDARPGAARTRLG